MGKKKIKVDKTQKKTILPYSPKKIRVKHPDPNSVLNPLTNSLSPSEKSKGVRFNSANMVGTQTKKQGKKEIKLKNNG